MHVTTTQLAAAGRRWFAKPPTGFSVPPAKGLANVQICAMEMLGTGGPRLRQIVEKGPVLESSVLMTQMGAVQNWLHRNGPTVFVTQDILSACENTEALGCVTGSDIRTVYPSIFFTLHDTGGFARPNGCVRYLWCCIIENSIAVWLGGTREDLPAKGRRLLIVAYNTIGEIADDFCLPLDSDRPLRDVIDAQRKEYLPLHDPGRIEHANGGTTITVSNDEQAEAERFGLWKCSLVVNLLLLMQSYPQYTRIDAKRSRQSIGHDAETPAFILARSAARPLGQTVNESRHPESVPDGSSKRPHWRRGHWRRQPHHDQYELENPHVQVLLLSDGRRAHMRWIEPIFVNETVPA